LGAEASDIEDEFKEEEKQQKQQQEQQQKQQQQQQQQEQQQQQNHHHQQQQQQLQASAEDGPQAATSGRLPTWGTPHGRNTYIQPFVGPVKGVKKSEDPHINKDSSPLSVLMLTQKFFICWWNRPTYTTSNT